MLTRSLPTSITKLVGFPAAKLLNTPELTVNQAGTFSCSNTSSAIKSRFATGFQAASVVSNGWSSGFTRSRERSAWESKGGSELGSCTGYTAKGSNHNQNQQHISKHQRLDKVTNRSHPPSNFQPPSQPSTRSPRPRPQNTFEPDRFAGV